MKNQKVYLAKSILASGLDFEYVKSNLLRIPNIEIIEYGDGYLPSECTCIVYVHDNVSAVQEDHAISVSKNVFNSIEEFVSQTEDGDAIAGIFVYLGKSHSTARDVEQTTPFMVPIVNYGELSESTWDEYGILNIEALHGLSLLECVSYSMDITNLVAWELNPRHDQPEEKYSLPAIPSLEERKSKGSKRNTVQKHAVYSSKKVLPQQKVKSSLDNKVNSLISRGSYEENEDNEEDLPVVQTSINGMTADDIISNRRPKKRY